jgi:hypothetical protein
MSALPSWRRAYGALKDSTTVSLANLNSDFKVPRRVVSPLTPFSGAQLVRFPRFPGWQWPGRRGVQLWASALDLWFVLHW